jgi:hypothetical protein
MLFKSVLLATFASLALAAPGGEYDHGDYNWGKDKCYVKHVTYYKTEVAYKTKTDYEYKTKTKVHSPSSKSFQRFPPELFCLIKAP